MALRQIPAHGSTIYRIRLIYNQSSYECHVSSNVGANVEIQLVETYASMNAQLPVAIGVERGGTSHQSSTRCVV